MDFDRRSIALYTVLAILTGASWVWAAGRVGGPATARDVGLALGAVAVVVALALLTYAQRRSGHDTRHVALAVALVLLVGATGVVAAAHLSGTVPVSGTIPLEANDGLVVNVDGANDMVIDDNTFVLSGTINVVTEQGNATFFSSGDASVTVAASDLEGTWTNLTSISADPNSIQVNPDDKPQITVGQEIDSLDFTTMAADDAAVDFVYSASGPGELTVEGLPASTEIFAIDAQSDAILDNTTTNSAGAGTFDALDSGSHNVLVQTNVNTGTPVLSDQSPVGDISTPPTELSVQVNDSAFARGDTVEVTFTLDGSTLNTQTISSNQTVTEPVPASGQTGGSHSWQVDAKDDFGNTASSSHTYNVPDQLTFREEEEPHPIIKNTGTGTLECEATLFEDVDTNPEIVRRTTTDGNISLTGLPVSSKFSVSVMCPHHHNRTTVIDDIFQQGDVFLIDKNRSTIENRFVVSNPGGNFPPDQTELAVQAAVNESKYQSGSPGISWLNIAGDDLGADESFTTDLVDEKRYRIRVQNDNGDTRILGAYTAETTGTIDLTIGKVDISPTARNGTAWSANWTNASAGQPTVNVQYNDTSDNTTTLHLHIYERGNESNELLANTSFTGPFGTFSTTEVVPKGENDTTWNVELVGEKSSGDNFRIVHPVGPGAPVLTDLPAWMVTLLFVGSILVVTGLFSQLNGHVGGLVIAGLGAMFYFVGLVPSYLGTGVVVLSLLIAGVLFLRGARAGGGL